MKSLKKRDAWFIGILLILTIISFFIDEKIMKLISSLRNFFFDSIFISVGFVSNVFIILFFLTTVLLWKKDKRRWILSLWLAVLLSTLISFLVKIIFKRMRPFQAGIVSVLGVLFYFMKDNFNTWNFSFPSFQAMSVFCALPILNKEFRKFRYVWLIFAIFVMLSRVYFGAHFLSDALAGALIGYIIGILTIKIEEKYEFGNKMVKKLRI